MMPGMPRFPGHPPSWMNGTGYPYGGPGGYSGGPNNGYGNGGNEQPWNGYSGYAGGYGAPMEVRGEALADTEYSFFSNT